MILKNFLKELKNATKKIYNTNEDISTKEIPSKLSKVKIKEEQEKTITPTKEIQEVTADNPEEQTLSKVTVNAIPDEYIVPSGELNIIEKGVYNVAQYEKVNVNVDTGEDFIYNFINHSLTEDIENTEVTEIRDYAFASREDNINKIYLPNVCVVGREAFWTTHIKELVLNFSEMTEIKEWAFRYSFIENPVDFVFDKVTYIGQSAFMESKIKTIKLPKTEVIDKYSFGNCSSLTDVYLGYNGVVEIPNQEYYSSFYNSTNAINIHVRPEYLQQYQENSNWSYSVSKGNIILIGDYSD